MVNVTDVLEARGGRYGNYAVMAALAQAIKQIVHDANARKGQGSRLSPDQLESLELIATKVARILAGDHRHVDSWRDIEGYARLIADRLEGHRDA